MQRKPRVRSTTVEKMATVVEGENKEEGAKAKVEERKRKKSLKVDLKETSGTCAEAGPPTEALDPISATIEAVLARAAASNTTVEKPKKPKRAKKRGQEAIVVKIPKQEVERTADGEENDDDSSAGIKECFETSVGFKGVTNHEMAS